ncbi:MAG: hypothetical protein S4CHLAM7_03900 [Chlamydiae bacterium]|nr:hypothetical protein [Chlamydiota bacterium]
MPKKNQLQFKEISENFKVLVEDFPNLVKIPQHFQDEIFEKASASKPLFNGTMICIKQVNADLITSYTLSFKEFLAANHLPRYPHKHTPLAVSGWIVHRQRVLFGVRSNNVLFFPGFLELVPSGGIDSRAVNENQEVLFEQALISEFEEETGMSPEDIESVTPEGLILTEDYSVLDICQSIQLDDSKEIDCDTHNEEYTFLLWVPMNELEEFILKNDKKILSTSLTILKNKILPKSS